ncbi:MAG: carboxymuconolactone decarboxylase family protein [Candidatus Acidiferrales bacterium]
MARIRPIPKERAAVVLRNLYDAAEKQFGAVPHLFQTMAHRPELLLTFANFHRELWTGGAVEGKIKELAGARAAALNGGPYSITHHGAAGERTGLSEQQQAAVQRDDWPASGVFDERERAVVRLAENLTRAPASITDEDIQALRRWFGEAHLVELALLIATVNLTSRFSQCFAVEGD